MKCDQKITRIQLKINPAGNISLFGLVSTEPDYKLSLILNKKLRISLKNSSPLTVKGNDGDPLLFSRFSCVNNSTEETYSLISNRSGKNFLVKNLRNVDYIFQIQDPECQSNAEQIASALKTIESITALFIIDSESIKEKYFHYLIH